MKTLVIGSSGQLGHDRMSTFGEAAIGLTHADIDVTDGIGVSRIVREQRGSMAIAAIGLAFPLFLLFGVLAVDVGNRYVHKRELQTQADAGALAAASAFTHPCDAGAISASAESYAGKDHNVFANLPASGSSRIFLLNQPNFAGQAKPGDSELTGNPCADNAVDVTVNVQSPRWAEFDKILNDVSAQVDTQTLAELYKQVDVDRLDAKDVASAWLKSKGFVP